jgi:hypothetical protein
VMKKLSQSSPPSLRFDGRAASASSISISIAIPGARLYSEHRDNSFVHDDVPDLPRGSKLQCWYRFHAPSQLCRKASILQKRVSDPKNQGADHLRPICPDTSHRISNAHHTSTDSAQLATVCAQVRSMVR